MVGQDERPSFANVASALGTPPGRNSRSPHRSEGRGSEPRTAGHPPTAGQQEPDLQSALTRLADAQADLQRTVTALTMTMLERDNNLQQAMAALMQQAAGGAATASAAAQAAVTAAAAGAAMQSAAGAAPLAPTAPQAKPVRIPKELDEALNKLQPKMESKLRGVVNTRRRLSTIDAILSGYVSDPDGGMRYPTGVRPFAASKTLAELDEPYEAVTDNDIVFSCTLKRGATHKEAMQCIHWHCSREIKRIERAAVAGKLAAATSSAKKEELCKLAEAIVHDASTKDRAEKLGLGEPLHEAIPTDSVRTKVLKMYEQAVDTVNKEEVDRECKARKEEAARKLKEVELLKANPSELFEKVVDHRIEAKLAAESLVAAPEQPGDVAMQPADAAGAPPEGQLLIDAIRSAANPKNGSARGGDARPPPKGKPKGKKGGKGGKGTDKAGGGKGGKKPGSSAGKPGVGRKGPSGGSRP